MTSIYKFLASAGAALWLALCPCCDAKAGGPELAQSEAKLATATLSVEGMTCASCEVAVRTALKKLDGVRSVRVSAKDKQAIVDYEPAKVNPETMARAIEQLGYKARVAKGA